MTVKVVPFCLRGGLGAMNMFNQVPKTQNNMQTTKVGRFQVKFLKMCYHCYHQKCDIIFSIILRNTI